MNALLLKTSAPSSLYTEMFAGSPSKVNAIISIPDSAMNSNTIFVISDRSLVVNPAKKKISYRYFPSLVDTCYKVY